MHHLLYTQIKFTSTEDPGNSKCAKRPIQSLPRLENLKKMKLSAVEIYKMAENELCCLRDNLCYEKKRSSDLENEVKDLRFKSSLGDVASDEENDSSVAVSCIGTGSFQVQHYQKHENSCIPVVAEIERDSKDLQAVDMHPDTGATVSIVSHICANERCEAAVETAGTVGYLQVLKDSEEGDSVGDCRNLMTTESVGIDDTYTENERTDSHSDDPGSVTHCSELCVKRSEVCPRLVEKEPAISAEIISDSVL